MTMSLGGGAGRIKLGEFGAEIAGKRLHAGTVGAGLGFCVVIRIGVDVVGVDRSLAVGDGLDSGNFDAISCEKPLLLVLQTGVDAVDDRELGPGFFPGRAKCVADGADIGRA